MEAMPEGITRFGAGPEMMASASESIFMLVWQAEDLSEP